MSAFFIYDSGPYGIFSPIRPLYQTKILTSLFLATPLSCNMMFLLFRKRCISNICPVIILAWQKIFQGKAFQNDIVPWGVYTYTWQEILSLYCRQNNNRVILSIYEESPKKYTSRLRFFGVTPSEWHTSRQGIFHCSNDVYFKGGSLLSFRARLSADKESSSYLR